MLNYKWVMPTTYTTPRDEQVARQLHVTPFIATMLRRRHFDSLKEAQKFLRPDLRQFVHDAHLSTQNQIHDMARGVRIIKRAIRKHEKITIYGDFDTDGITATSIMYLLLRHFGADVVPFIPNRFKDGYGPNIHEYKRIIHNGTKLLITVDNGIAGKKQITYARKHGMDVILTDHHDFPTKRVPVKTTSGKIVKDRKGHIKYKKIKNHKGELTYKRVLDLPPANAIIMGKYPGHRFHRAPTDDDTTDFCGAGIAFMIANYMLGHVPTHLLDIATLGTIADSVHVTKENRTIVKYGLQSIRDTQRPGIQAMANVADIDLPHMTSTQLSFSLIPRLNALGRMRDANVGVTLLTTNDISKAEKLAVLTEQCNRKRKAIMRKQLPEVLKQADSPANRKRNFLVLYDKNWYPGIVGIMASHVVEKFWKPTIVIGHLASDGNKDRGSGRSIDGFNLFKAMAPCRKDMLSFGGHPGACGLSIAPNKIKKLRSDLNKHSGKVKKLYPTIKPDMVTVPKFLNNSLIRQLQILEPFGVGNEAPQICVKADQIFNIKPMGDGSHMRFNFKTGLRAVAFHMGFLLNSLKQNPYNLEITGTLGLNHYNHRTYPQFVVSHIRHYTESSKPIRRPNNSMTTKIRQHLGLLYNFLRTVASRTNNTMSIKYVESKSPNVIHNSLWFVRCGLQIFYELHLLGVDPNHNCFLKNVDPSHKHTLKDSITYKKLLKQLKDR